MIPQRITKSHRWQVFAMLFYFLSAYFQTVLNNVIICLNPNAIA